MPPERALSLLRGEICRKNIRAGDLESRLLQIRKRACFAATCPFGWGRMCSLCGIVINDKFSCKKHFIIDILDNAV